MLEVVTFYVFFQTNNCGVRARVKTKRMDVKMTMMMNKTVFLFPMVISVMMKVMGMAKKTSWIMTVVIKKSHRYSLYFGLLPQGMLKDEFSLVLYIKDKRLVEQNEQRFVMSGFYLRLLPLH